MTVPQQAEFGACADVTEAAKAEQLLREQTALLANTLDNMAEGLFVVGPDQRLVMGNRRGFELFRMPAEWATSQPSMADAVAYQASLGIVIPARDKVASSDVRLHIRESIATIESMDSAPGPSGHPGMTR